MSNQRDYEKFIRIAYNQSNDALRLTIPKSVKFPATIAHCHLKDQSHLVIDTIPTEMTTWSRHFSSPGTSRINLACRGLVIMGVTRIGQHFRMTNTVYQVEGSRLIIKIPDEHERESPKRVGRRSSLPPRAAQETVAPSVESTHSANAATATENEAAVLVEVYDDTYEFAIPKKEMLKIVMDWTEKGWRR